MEASLCSQEETPNLFFLHPPNDDAPSSILECAFQICEEKQFHTQWLSQEECLKVTPTKEDVFICDPFEGEAFDYLVASSKSIVVGPRCVLSCLHRMEAIPIVPSPLHNTAMMNLVVTSTGFSRPEKEELQRLIQRMSGIYSNNYHQGVTHLVVKRVGSEKYKVAVQQQVPVMIGEWVTAVWEAVMNGSSEEHVSATDDCFLQYRCKPLHGLVVCVSQVTQHTKNEMKSLIEENGGVYTTKLTMGETSILIVSSPEGKKYSFAIKWGIPCVYPEWLQHSVEQGYAVEEEEYEVQARKTSTLTDSHMENDLPSDISMCSTILSDTTTTKVVMSVDETVSLEESLSGRKANTSSEANSQQEEEEVEALSLQEALKAGDFLAGCSVYLAGFSTTHMEKLRRVLRAGGASRLSNLSESVTHVMLASPKAEHIKAMHGWATKPYIVSVRWLAESIRLKHPADESNFLIQLEADQELQPPRIVVPISQRSSISTSFVDPNDETHIDEALLKVPISGPRRRRERESIAEENYHDDSTLPQSQASELPGIFYGKNFTIAGHSQETKGELAEVIELNGGHVLSVSEQQHQSATIHFTVITAGGGGGAPYYHQVNQGHKHHTQLVSSSFLDECVESQRLLPVEYYHLPLLLPADSVFPLEDCCITVSVYTLYERRFLENLLTLLGARNQDKFTRSAKTDKNLQANTHLVCPTPTGTKYSAAKKWGIKAVTCDWLIECARARSRVPEEPFLVESGDPVQVPRKAVIRELWDSAHGGGGNEKKEEEEEEEEEIPATPGINRIKPLPSSEACSSLTPEKVFDREAISQMYPTPGTTRYYKAKREAELDAMPTPDTPYGCTWYDDPPPRVRKCIKRLINSLPDPPNPPDKSTEPARSPTIREMFLEFMERTKVELEPYLKKYQCELEEIERKEKRANNKEEQTEAEEPHHSPIMNEDDGKQEKESGRNTVHEKEKLSHQLEEIARASCVERSGGSSTGGRNKVPLGELQRPVTSKPHHIDLESQPNEEEEPPLATQITWDDPQELVARLSLEEQMHKDTQDFSVPPVHKELQADRESNSDDDYNKENVPSSPVKNIRNRTTPNTGPNKDKAPSTEGITTTTAEAPSPLPPQPPVFQLAGFNGEELLEYTETVMKLGGSVSVSKIIEPNVTHVVAVTLSPSERILSSIVSGRWVLMVSYLDDSLKAGSFLQEEPYAWGNPAAIHTPILVPENNQPNLAAAAWKWRCSIVGDGESDSGYDGDHHKKERKQQRRPFEHITALIHGKKDRANSYTRLIEAGGGQVISARPPYSEVTGVSHFFMEPSNTKEKVDLASFASRGIPCLNPLYIRRCILEDNPDVSESYIPAYKEIMANMSTCIPSPLRRVTHRK